MTPCVPSMNWPASGKAGHLCANRENKMTTEGPFKWFQHLLQYAFNTLLNQMSEAFEQVIQHCWKCKKCWKLVENVLNQIQIGFNFHSTSIQPFFFLENVEWCWSRLNTPFNICPTSAQHLFSFNSNVENICTALYMVRYMYCYNLVFRVCPLPSSPFPSPPPPHKEEPSFMLDSKTHWFSLFLPH